MEPKVRLTIELMQEIASSRGGECLSHESVSWDTSLRWRCSKGHEWNNRAGKVKSGQWCPTCAGKSPKGLGYLQGLAAKMGGECLSQEYTGMQNLAKWRCQYGHTWEAKPNNVKFGNWCPFCVGKRQTIEDLQELAASRSGKCLSSEYLGQAKKHKWRCVNNHEWSATPNSIKNGSWCPKCNINFGEEVCRVYLETIFGRSFPKVRPDFLVSSSGGSLELDGFCEELMLAFEHHGLQHYEHSPIYHRSDKDFIAQKERDLEKLKLCREAGISVIEVPAIPEITSTDALPALIREKLASLGVVAPFDGLDTPIDLSRVYGKSDIDALQKLARSRGGELLSITYLGDKGRLRWRCQNGHEWLAGPNGIKTGTWCPYCYGNVRKSYEAVRSSAKQRGLTLVDDDYLGTNAKHTWECERGHRWQATPHKVLIDGTGCPLCAGKHKTIQDMAELARERGGVCLSSEYLGMSKSLDWKCKEGHVFSMTPAYARSRKEEWCPICRELEKKSARAQARKESVEEIVRNRGGRIVSGEFNTVLNRITLQCSSGHQWSTILEGIVNGTWCPECYRLSRIKVKT